MDTAEAVKNEAGKREASQAGAEDPPPPKCLQLPTESGQKKVEEFDIAKDDTTEEKDASNIKVPE